MDQIKVAVRLEAGSRRDEVTHDDVLLESAESVRLAEGGCFGENTRCVLEGCGRDEAVGLERGLGDSQQNGGRFRWLSTLRADALVLTLKLETVDLIAPE